MSREFDDIRKKIDQSHKELYKQDAEISKDIDSIIKKQESLYKDIADIKKQVKDISNKVDLMLEILNNFNIMLLDEDEEVCEDNLEDSFLHDEWDTNELDGWSDGEDESLKWLV